DKKFAKDYLAPNDGLPQQPRSRDLPVSVANLIQMHKAKVLASKKSPTWGLLGRWR
ncbi:hypothetical protein XPU_0659, partial [Xanthomonas arboricola pv. pruni str. MAFF 311562]